VAKLLWTQKNDIGPDPRAEHAMVFDVAKRTVVLFGGLAAGSRVLQDTWSWDGQDWTQLQDIGPAERTAHAMAYDATRQRTVLFGGRSGNQEFGDTWEWDGDSWTQVQDTGPRARFGHAMAYDAARNRVVLFGGAHVAGTAESDTWAWDGSDWSQVEDTGPSARSSHAMAYDGPRSRTVLFGGVAPAQGATFGDTWEWDGTAWKHVQDIGAAPAAGAAMAFRTATAALFGGISAVTNVPGRRLFGLTWEWNGHLWTARQDIGVGPRYEHAMAFDSVRNRVVLFGGRSVPADTENADAGLKGDTWEHPDVVPNPSSSVPVASVSVTPNPASPGSSITITVQLQSAAPAGGDNVELGGDFGSLGTITVPPGSSAGSASFQLPQNIPGLPLTGNITATGGGVTQSVSLTIQ
jgi:hypothetical protein